MPDRIGSSIACRTGMSGVITAGASKQRYQGVPVATIKKHATGKGNAGKEEMIAAAKARGHQPTDDNEADALAILHWVLAGGASCPR